MTYSAPMNASGSGAPAHAGTQVCAHTPQSGTIYTSTGLRATLNALPASYPLEAMCASCGQLIHCEAFTAGWALKEAP